MIPVTLRLPAGLLGQATVLEALLPEPARFPPPWPQLWLLHGRSDDASAWLRQSTLERQADGFGLAVFLPTGFLSFYRNDQEPRGWESAFTEEWQPMMEALFPLRRDRRGRAIGGLSMGGYGALWLGVRHRDRFGAVSAHSPAVVEARRTEGPNGTGRRFFPADLAEEETLLGLLGRVPAEELPALRIDCGDRDYLLEEARILHARLRELGIAHEYAERAGGHDWMYWEKHVHATLRFAWTVARRS